MGPFTFNGVRFALGSISLIPLIVFYSNRAQGNSVEKRDVKMIVGAGAVAGLVLFVASSLQQIGIIGTTAGKAAFITGLYMVIVPILGIFLKHRINMSTWLGAITASVGLYVLCVTKQFSISYFDLIVLIGAFFWAVHILLIDHFCEKVDVLKLAFFQFMTCAILSLVVAGLTEEITMAGLRQALIPIVYGGVFSVGIAYTLQIVGQKHAQPSHAAIIMSMETCIAAIGGWLLLNEKLGIKGTIGCALMFAGMMLSQLPNLKKRGTTETSPGQVIPKTASEEFTTVNSSGNN